jgi:hypothetical protein
LCLFAASSLTAAKIVSFLCGELLDVAADISRFVKQRVKLQIA